jgi:hypothetical protein
MKVFTTFALVFLFLINPFGTSNGVANPLNLNFTYSDSPTLDLDSLEIENGKVNKRFQKLIQRLDNDFEKHQESEEFLRLVFYRTQQQMLNKYIQYSSFNELIRDGSFDCVSGSTLFALILERYNLNYQIIETSYHVFLEIELKGKNYIFESTEPIEGFIAEKEEIKAFKDFHAPSASEKVQRKIAEESGNGTSQLLQPVVYKSITLEELIGLQFFNKAVYYFNQEQFFEAYNSIVKAKKYYPSERLLTLSKILENTVFSSSKE